MAKPRITFKLRPHETGLMAVGASPRSSEIKLDGETIGRVYPSGGGWRELRGWYWVVSDGPDALPYRNTSGALVSTADEAKAEAKAWILDQLAAAAA